MQIAVDRWVVYYNNYRKHSSLGWQSPITHFAGLHLRATGFAQLPGMEDFLVHLDGIIPHNADPPPTLNALLPGYRCALILAD